jgi:hypothetical protein
MQISRQSAVQQCLVKGRELLMMVLAHAASPVPRRRSLLVESIRCKPWFICRG